MIKKYFKKIDILLDDFNHLIEDYILNKEYFTNEKGIVKGEIYFIDESRLVFLEVLNTKKKSKEKYRYHYMNKNEQLIFRYDNARHHDLLTFHHKHTSSNILESKEPNLEYILHEIETEILKNN